MTGTLTRVDPTHAANKGGGNHAAYQTAIEQHPSHEPFWVATFDDPVATFTFVLAIVTLCLLGANLLLWLSTRGALRLARDEFNATHRPRIILRQVTKVEELGTSILYTLANTGDSEATIAESWILLEHQPDSVAVRNVRATGHDDLGSPVLKPGESRDFSLAVTDPNAVDHLNRKRKYPTAGESASYVQAFGSVGNLHFAGAINYVDESGNKRTSVFRRYWNPHDRGFFRTDDPDNEYTD